MNCYSKNSLHGELCVDCIVYKQRLNRNVIFQWKFDGVVVIIYKDFFLTFDKRTQVFKSIPTDFISKLNGPQLLGADNTGNWQGKVMLHLAIAISISFLFRLNRFEGFSAERKFK